MWYLFLQMYGWIFLAFVLGWLSHWFLCCRGKENEQTQSQTVITEQQESNIALAEPLQAVEATPATIDLSGKPQGFTARPDDADELKRIKGIGAVIEETLNELGIYKFKQISSWDDSNVSWVEKFLAFPGRIGRENWISQATTLDQGGTTEFADRVDKGDVSYK